MVVILSEPAIPWAATALWQFVEDNTIEAPWENKSHAEIKDKPFVRSKS